MKEYTQDTDWLQRGQRDRRVWDLEAFDREFARAKITRSGLGSREAGLADNGGGGAVGRDRVGGVRARRLEEVLLIT